MSYHLPLPRRISVSLVTPPPSTGTVNLRDIMSTGTVNLRDTMPRTLRLSVTERCNFRCRYCAPPDGFPKTPYHCLPSLDQLADAAEWLSAKWNVRRIRVTGGEPLVRPGLIGIIERLANIQGISEVSLTTNGSSLKKLAKPLKQAGLKRVNVSLDTMNSDRFLELCRGNLSETLEGIEAAVEADLQPVKLNAVLHKSTWREDVPKLLDYAAATSLEIRFIELMQIGPSEGWARREFVAANDVREWIQDRATVADLKYRDGVPARQTSVIWGEKEITVGWITPESESFCLGCDRLRLDCHGRLRRCLMDTAFIPLVEILEKEGDEAAQQATSFYLEGKQPPKFMHAEHSMIMLGG